MTPIRRIRAQDGEPLDVSANSNLAYSQDRKGPEASERDSTFEMAGVLGISHGNAQKVSLGAAVVRYSAIWLHCHGGMQSLASTVPRA